MSESNILYESYALYGNIDQSDLTSGFERLLRRLESKSSGHVDWGSLEFSVERNFVEETTFMSNNTIQETYFGLHANVLEVFEEEEEVT